MGDLTEAQRWLVELMAEYQFGRLEDLGVRSGLPAPDQRLKIIRAARFGKDDERKASLSDDPELKRVVWDLMEQIEKIRDGCIVRLEFRHGLPYLLEIGAAVAFDRLPIVPPGQSLTMP